MRVIYIANDGKEFDDEFDCCDYEWQLNHPHLKDILFYDENNCLLGDITSDDTYNVTEKIIVPNKKSLKDLQELGKYCGFCCYEDINECGEWTFDFEQGKFIKT